MKFHSICNWIQKICLYIAALLNFAMVVIVFWQVITRYVLKSSTGWTQELTMVIFMWVTLLGAATAVKSKGHVSMTLLINKIKGYANPIIHLIGTIICLAFYVMLTWSGFSMAKKFAKAGTTQLGIPMWLVYGSFIACGIVMCIFAIEQVAEFTGKITAISQEKNDLIGGAK